MLFSPVLTRAMYNVGRPTVKTRDQLADANDAVASLSWRGYILSIGRCSSGLTSLFGDIHTVYRGRAALLRDRSVPIDDAGLKTIEQETNDIDAALAVAVVIPPTDDDGIRRLQNLTMKPTMPGRYRRKPPFVSKLPSIPESDNVYDDDENDRSSDRKTSAAPGQ